MTEVSEVLTAVSGRLSRFRRGGVSGPATAFLSPARKAGFADGGPVASDAVTVGEELAAAALPVRRRSAGGLWFQGVGGVGRLDGGVDYDWRGMVGGLDAALFSPDLRLGVFAGGVNGGEETAYDKSETRNATAGIYGGYAMGGGWYVSGQAGWTRVRVSNRRRLEGSTGEARSDYADRVCRCGRRLAGRVPGGRVVAGTYAGSGSTTCGWRRSTKAALASQRSRGDRRGFRATRGLGFGLPDGSTWTRGWRWSRNSALAGRFIWGRRRRRPPCRSMTYRRRSRSRDRRPTPTRRRAMSG